MRLHRRSGAVWRKVENLVVSDSIKVERVTGRER